VLRVQGEEKALLTALESSRALAHLKDGWQIVKELSNGEVIVKRVR
jgi:hypothetical protein